MQPADRTETVAYVSCADDAEIDVLSLDAGTGALRPVQKVPVGGTVMPMAVSPDRRFLYAASRSKPYGVGVFAIERGTGRLSPVQRAPLPESMAYISLDRTGRTLLGASYGGNLVSVNRIDADGLVGPQPAQILPTRPKAHAVLADLDNRYVLATSLGGDVVLQYRFDPATGHLAPNTPPEIRTAKGAGPRFLVFSPDRRFVYATNELSGTLAVFAFDAASGTLTSAQEVRVAPEDLQDAPATADLHLTPDGSLLYASERTSSTIAGFRVDRQTGRLALIGHTPTEAQPRGFNIDPAGRYLLAAGQGSNAITSYAIDGSTGALMPLHRVGTGRNPNWIEIIDLC
jgi:6-phosphogluconolactonase